MPFFFLFNSNTFQLLTNYQLLSTSLFQGEPGWAEEPQEWLVSSHPLLGSQERTQEPRTSASSGHRTQDHTGTQDLRLLEASDPGPHGNPGPPPPRGIRPRTSAPCWDRTECGEQACVSDQEGKSTAGLVPSPWLFPLDYVPASVSQKWLAKAPGVSWPALHSQQAASSSRRWPPAHTASLWSGPPGRCKAGRDTGGAETHRRDVAVPHWPSGPSGLRCPVSCWEAMSRVRSGREGKGPGGRCPAVPAACLLALPLSHRVEAPLARPLLLAAGTREVSGTPFPPELEATCSGRALETVWRRLPAAPPRGPLRDQGFGLGGQPQHEAHPEGRGRELGSRVRPGVQFHAEPPALSRPRARERSGGAVPRARGPGAGTGGRPPRTDWISWALSGERATPRAQILPLGEALSRTSCRPGTGLRLSN